MTTLREVVTEFCLMGDRVEALEAINDLIRAERARAHAEGLEAGAGKLVKLCDSDPDLTDFALSRIHAQARKLRSLIPAAPEVPSAEEET